MSFDKNETVIIKRGKLGGQQGTVSDVSGEDVAVKLDSGGITVQKLTNLRAPEQATISEGDLAAIVRTEIGVSRFTPEVFASLVHAIDAKLPGFAARVDLDGFRDPSEPTA